MAATWESHHWRSSRTWTSAGSFLLLWLPEGAVVRWGAASSWVPRLFSSRTSGSFPSFFRFAWLTDMYSERRLTRWSSDGDLSEVGFGLWISVDDRVERCSLAVVGAVVAWLCEWRTNLSHWNHKANVKLLTVSEKNMFTYSEMHVLQRIYEEWKQLK